ncbi:unnamed protein product [Parnassius mnemosyne]
MRTLKSLLTIIECDSDSSWQDQIGEIQLALNGTRCRVTGFTPIELMFGIQGDYVFVKSEERHQTKLDRKYKGSFKITAVLNNDRYELKHINGSNRIFKYSHENLREVPRGPSACLDIIENCSEDNEELQQADINDHEIYAQLDNTSETDTAGSSTLTSEKDDYHTTSSRTISIDSEDTMSVYSEPTIIVTQADIHRANDSD